MNKIFAVLLVTALTGMIGTGIGGILAINVKLDSKRVIGLLLGFAGGITLGTVCFDFIPEAVHSGKISDHSAIVTVALCVAAGYIAVSLFDRFTSGKPHHDHSSHCHGECPCCGSDPQKMMTAGTVMAFSIALHNLPVGIVIGASMATDPSKFISVGVLTTALAIVIHNIPEGMAVAVPFLSGGMKKPFALLATSACGITTVIGGLIGYSLGTLSPLALTIMLGIAAGAMLFVILNELIPEAFSCLQLIPASLSVLVGLLLSMVIVLIGGHNH